MENQSRARKAERNRETHNPHSSLQTLDRLPHVLSVLLRLPVDSYVERFRLKRANGAGERSSGGDEVPGVVDTAREVGKDGVRGHGEPDCDREEEDESGELARSGGGRGRRGSNREGEGLVDLAHLCVRVSVPSRRIRKAVLTVARCGVEGNAANLPRSASQLLFRALARRRLKWY